jgi:hypothetical protein
MNAPRSGHRTLCALATLTASSILLLLPASAVRGQGRPGSQTNLRNSVEDLVSLLGQAVRDGNRGEIRQVDRALQDLIHVMEHRWSHHHHHHHHHGHFHHGMQHAAHHQHHNGQPTATSKTGSATGSTSSGGRPAANNQLTSAAKAASSTMAGTAKTAGSTTAVAGKNGSTKTSSLAANAAAAGPQMLFHGLQQSQMTKQTQPTHQLQHSKQPQLLQRSTPGLTTGARLASALAGSRNAGKQLTPQALAKTGRNAGSAVGQHKTTLHATAAKKK